MKRNRIIVEKIASIAIAVSLFVMSFSTTPSFAFSYYSGGDRLNTAQSVELGKEYRVKINSVGFGRYFRFKTTGNRNVIYRISATSNLMSDEMDYGFFA